MPEGPEVRHNGEMLEKLIVGRRIDELKAVSGKLLRNGISGARSFKPSIVQKVEVRGKLIIVRFMDGSALTSTLGMSGWWYPPPQMASQLYATVKAYQSGKLVLASSIVDKALKYTRVELTSNGVPLACFSDMRNFGNIEYLPDGLPEEKIIQKIGLDLLNQLPTMSMADSKQRLLDIKSKAPRRILNTKLGDLALEQNVIAGLGNIYRAEALWLTGLDPYRKFETLADDEWLFFCEVGMAVLIIAYAGAGVMNYSRDLIEQCTGVQPLRDLYREHMAYGRSTDIFGRIIVRDDSFNRPLWRLA